MNEVNRVYRRLEDVRYLFYQNYNELKKFQESYNEDQYFSIFSNDNQLVIFQREELRKIYNFMTAGSTLKEFMNKNINKMRLSSLFLKEYKEKVKDIFAESDIAQFLEACRNSFIHEGIQLGQSNLDFGSKKETKYTLFLDMKQLISSAFWDKKGNAYATKNHSIDLFKVCNEYFEITYNFHQWFDDNNEIAIVEGRK